MANGPSCTAHNTVKNGLVILKAKDKPGIHQAILRVVSKANYTLTDPSGGSKDGHYFLRNAFSATKKELTLEEFEYQFRKALSPLKLEGLSIRVENAEKRKAAAILVSEQTYCLKELLHQWDEGGLNFGIECIISNSTAAEKLVNHYGIRFEYVDAGIKIRDFDKFDAKKLEAERKIYGLTTTKVDFYILAKWHRILSRDGPLLSCGVPIVSVHPSLLPAFIGGHAIRDAYEAGVKVTGATSHLVTREDKGIDEGPKLLQVPKSVGNLSWPAFEKTVQFAEREAIYYAAKMMAECRWIEYKDPISQTRKTFTF
jgi:formyltetrahydrofolate deformylase